jgi:hypothetical protein
MAQMSQMSSPRGAVKATEWQREGELTMRIWISGLAALALVLGTIGVRADERATVQLRNGDRIAGNLDALANGLIYVRVSHADQRKLPVADVALIDLVGGATGLPETELNEARGDDHLLLLKGGSSQKGRLIGIHGGTGSAEPNAPRVYEFRTTSGEERRIEGTQVARIYLGRYPAPSTAGVPPPTPPVPAGAIRVPASANWVSTGLRVARGERVAFSTTGEVQLSDNTSDRAGSAGATRTAPGSAVPTVGAGALVGRIGPSGRAFAIGNQTMVPMPAAGLLYLAVNDDERSDNQGEFVVTVSSTGRTR